MKLGRLGPAHVERLMAQMLADGLSDSTATRVRATLSVALNQAMRDLGLPRNVASLAKVPKSDRPAFTREVVTPDQARTIVGAFEGHRLQPLVMFSLATGVRQGELLALRWGDIDLASRTVTIRHAVDVQNRKRVLARPKSSRSQRLLRLPELAIAALQLRRQQEEQDWLLAGERWRDLRLVFPNRTGGIRTGEQVTKVSRPR